MKKEEKTRLSLERIRNAALAEFGAKGYEDASLNVMCAENGISKGLLYHNFKSKDELYLYCVKDCFEKLTSYLNNAECNNDDSLKDMQNILAQRRQFFRENPAYSSIFIQCMLRPPRHLEKEIRKARQDFNDFNEQRMNRLLDHIQLRPGVTRKVAAEYTFHVMEVFNSYFESHTMQGSDLPSMNEDREEMLANLLQLILYGIAVDDGAKEQQKENPIE